MGVKSINFVDILSEFGSRSSLDFLDFFESLGEYELFLLLSIVGESFGELVQDILENIGWGFGDESFKSWEVATHLQNTFQGFLGLLF